MTAAAGERATSTRRPFIDSTLTAHKGWGFGADFGSLDFDFNPEKKKSDHKLSERVLRQRAVKRRLRNDELHFRSAKALEDLCVEPKPGEQWRIVTEKAFNAYALILHVVSSRTIEELYLAVYRINEPTVEAVIEMVKDGRISKAVFIISSFFNQTKKPERWALRLKEFADADPRCRHVYTHNHAKVVCIKSGADHFVFEGSGNMSDNARIEQYLYENNEMTYNFHKTWMEELADGKERDKQAVP